MPPVTLHQPVAGLDRGQTYSGPMERWLVVNGYASDGSKTDKTHLTGVEDVADDPQLAENREKPVDVEAQHLVPGAPSLDRELEYDGLAAGLSVEDEPVEDVALADRDAETLPPPRNRTIGAAEDDAVAALYSERYDNSRAGEDVEELEVPDAPARRNLTVGATDETSRAQANAVLEPDPRAADETKPKVRRTRKAAAPADSDE